MQQSPQHRTHDDTTESYDCVKPLASSAGTELVSLARLSFRYGPALVPLSEREAALDVAREGRLYRIERDRAAESRAVRRLKSLGLVKAGDGRAAAPMAWSPHRDDFRLPDADDDPLAWLDFLFTDRPALEREGWTVEVADDFPLRLARPEGGITAELEQGGARRQAEADGTRSIQNAEWRLQAATRELQVIVGTAREQGRQNLWVLGAAGGGLLVGLVVLAPLLLYALPTGLQTRLVATVMGADRWQAGATMMQAASPEGWSEFAAASDLVQTNEKALEICRVTAAKARSMHRCVLTVRPPPNAGGQ